MFFEKRPNRWDACQTPFYTQLLARGAVQNQCLEGDDMAFYNPFATESHCHCDNRDSRDGNNVRR